MVLRQRGGNISSERILESIENGHDIDLDEYVVIEGNLDLSKLRNMPTGIIRNRFVGGIALGLCRGIERKIINSSIKIHHSKFLGKINFSCCIFNKDISFWYCDIDKDFVAEGSEFQSDVWFNRVRFNGVTSFRGTYFCRDAEFFLSEFTQIADFGFTCFEGFAYFYEAKIKEFIKFNAANFHKELSLDRSLINTIDLDARFLDDSKIGLTESYFQKFLVSWKTIEDRLIYNEPAYLALEKNFEALGKFDDADRCYHQYRNKRRDALRGFPRLLDYFLLWVYGYGRDPLSFGIFCISNILQFHFIFYL